MGTGNDLVKDLPRRDSSPHLSIVRTDELEDLILSDRLHKCIGRAN